MEHLKKILQARTVQNILRRVSLETASLDHAYLSDENYVNQVSFKTGKEYLYYYLSENNQDS